MNDDELDRRDERIHDSIEWVFTVLTAPEQRAASALLSEAHEAEARRHLIDPWRERRQ